MIHKIASMVRRCIDDYNMIDGGETVAVGVSGGKDSLALLHALASLRQYHPKAFKLHAVTLTMGFEGMDFSPVARFCEDLDVPYTLKETDIGKIVFEARKEENPCSLCARMRRGALSRLISQLGIRKIALAHHFDDAVETFLLSLLYEGRIHCFQPVTYLSRSDTTQIRPMLYVKEDAVRKLASAAELPVVENTCPMNGFSKREHVKQMLKALAKEHPDIKQKVFGAMQRLPVHGWKEPV